MAVGKGLAGIKKAKEEAAQRRAASTFEKVEWFTLKGRPNGARVRFLQELDTDGKHYDSNRGMVITVVEHQAPGKEGWKARGMCTFEDEGRCYACERHTESPSEGWKAKTNLYANILDEDGVVKVLSRNVNNSFVDTLVEWYDGSQTITELTFKLKETGEGFNKTWTMTPAQPALEDSGLTLYDLEKSVVRHIPYDAQQEYYGRVYTAPSAVAKTDNADDSESLPW